MDTADQDLPHGVDSSAQADGSKGDEAFVEGFERHLDQLMEENEAHPRTQGYIKTHRTRFVETVRAASSLIDGCKDMAEIGPLSYPGVYISKTAGLAAGEVLGDLRFPVAYPSESADLVLFLEVFEHINDALTPDSSIDEIAEFRGSGAQNILNEIHRILRPGGAMLMTTPNGTSLDSILCLLDKKNTLMYPRHVREYAPREVIDMAEASGFVLERFYTYFAWWNYAGGQRIPLLKTLEAAGYDMTDRGDDAVFVFRKPV